MSEMLVEPPCWSEARAKHLADLDARSEALTLTDPWEYLSHLRDIERERKRVAEHPDWIAERPVRRMPTALKVAKYWSSRELFWRVTVTSPRCFRCQIPGSRWALYERAHLVDRVMGGLDHEGNMAMLCYSCHLLMPSFAVDEWEDAVWWIILP